MRSYSKEQIQKPYANRQVIDIKGRDEGDERRKSSEIGFESGIWSRFIYLMKNSLNISLLSKSNQADKSVASKVKGEQKSHMKEILLKKYTQSKGEKQFVQTFNENNIENTQRRNFWLECGDKKSSFSPRVTRTSPKMSLKSPKSSTLSLSLPSSSSSSFSSFSSSPFSPSKFNGNLGISFAEQILNCNSNDYSKTISGQIPVTPTTLDGSSTTTSPAFTNIHLPSPSNKNSPLKLNDTPRSKETDYIERLGFSPLRGEYYSNKRNHAVDFSADDNHLNNIMEKINQGEYVDFGEKSTRLNLSLISQFNSQDLLLDGSGFYDERQSGKGTLLGRGLSTFQKQQFFSSFPQSFSPTSRKFDRVCYSWKEAKQLIGKLKSSTKVYKFNGVSFSDWVHEKIPTLGASPTSCRVQEMFKSKVYADTQNKNSPYTTLFVKKVPRSIWVKQWEMHEIWDGDYVTDGEDFVMEAAALAFLQGHSTGIAPRLYAILEHNEGLYKDNGKIPSKTLNLRATSDHFLCKDTTHIILVSEYYGEDLLDYLDKCERENKVLTEKEKKDLQYNLVLALNSLHSKGLSHLDFTPENILVGPNGINICDFAKSTPIMTKNPRHTHYSKKNSSELLERFGSSNSRVNEINPPPEAYYEFESCEPTVGKGAYMPPECWKIFWKLEEHKIQFPLEELMDGKVGNSKYNYANNQKDLVEVQDRSIFYFNVRIADIYMLGIIMFWIWSDGGIWKYSDTRQDHRYQNLVFSEINFDVFRECRNWNKSLKRLLRKMLEPDPSKRITMNEILCDPWWKCTLESKG
ncbi:Serine/threonine protein kinase [Cryptosporidium felis]|nr:Serine/threonine protein kinase [Cryptosporidium felis]